jgi:cytosine/adenosine deaminase-related metal-dependent hydrolase
MRRWLLASLVLTLGACSGIDSVPLTDAGADSSGGDTSDDASLPDASDDTSDTSDTSDTGVAPDTGSADDADATTLDAADAADGSADASEASPDAASDAADTSDASAEGSTDAATCPSATHPEITRAGTTSGKVLLRGTVVGPDTFYVGEVLVEGDTITCAAASCASMAGAATATIVDTHGIIFPGLIDTHNHILFDIFDETHWSPTKSYTNHNQWTAEARYSAMVDAKQWLNNEAGPTPRPGIGCELDKFGELKGLVAGTTSIAGSANAANRACYGSLARTIDQTPNGLPDDKVQMATLFPTAAAATGVCGNFTDGSTDAYLIHIAEGTDATALAEFAKLGSITTPASCLYAPKTTIVHGTALGDAELTTMATNGMGLTWSPRSNVFLYGGGTDLTKTTNIPLAISKGINVALAPDWSMGGSQNLLDELRFADKVDNGAWGDKLTPKMLFAMVTKNAAKNLGLSAVLGSIEVGKKADLMVISGLGMSVSAPYDALLAATPREVRLVMVGGVTLYGDVEVKSLGPAAPGCETLDVCCGSKFACVAVAGGTATDKLGQTYAEITAAIAKGLTDYDALALTAWKFAPSTPLVRCP